MVLCSLRKTEVLGVVHGVSGMEKMLKGLQEGFYLLGLEAPATEEQEPHCWDSGQAGTPCTLETLFRLCGHQDS